MRSRLSGGRRFIGRHVAREFVRGGHEVLVIAHKWNKASVQLLGTKWKAAVALFSSLMAFGLQESDRLLRIHHFVPPRPEEGGIHVT